MLGDNCTIKEDGIKDSDILAAMTSFIRNGRKHNENEVAYKIYSFVWLKLSPLRIFLRLKIFPIFEEDNSTMTAGIPEIMIYLASCAVNRTSPETGKLTEIDFEALFLFASYHVMSAVVAMILEHSGVKNDFVKNAISFSIRKNIFFETANNSVLKSLKKPGYGTCR